VVYLAGKDEQGCAIILEDDGVTPHTHKSKVPSQQQQQQLSQQQTQQQLQSQQQATITDLLVQMKLLNQKMDKLLEVFDYGFKSQGWFLPY
jgi:hypothetical protein